MELDSLDDAVLIPIQHGNQYTNQPLGMSLVSDRVQDEKSFGRRDIVFRCQ